MSDSALTLVALVVAVLALAVAALAVAQAGRARAQVRVLETQRPVGAGDLAALRADIAQALRHVAVVRYDAFADTGGQLSWSLALLDDGGSGIVVTAIQGRNESRTYAKSISDWSSEAQLSPEEEDAISHARP